MSNFSQFKPAERSLSDVESVQAPVQRSTSNSSSAFVDTALALGQVALTGYKIGKDREAASLKFDQEEALVKQKGEFETELLRAKGLADKHGSQSVMFNTFLTKSFDQSQLDFDVKSKMLKDFQGTVLGKSFTTLSPEEKAFNKVVQDAGEGGWYTADSSEQEVEEGTAAMLKANKRVESDNAELATLNLKKAQIGLSVAERNEVDKQFQSKQFEAVANLAANFRTPIKSEVKKIMGDFSTGVTDKKMAKQELLAARGDLVARVATMSRGVDTARVGPLSAPLLELYDRAITSLDSENPLKELQDANAMITAKTDLNLKLNSPELVRLASVSSLTGHNNPTITAKITEASATFLAKNSDADGKPIDITDDGEDTKIYRELISEGISNQNKTKPDGTPVTNPEELLVNMGNILKGGARFFDGDDLPSQNQAFLEWVAQPDVGGYIGENFSQLPAAARQKLSDSLRTNATNFVYPKATDLFNSELNAEQQEQVEVMQQGDQVVFRSKTSDPWIKSVAQKLNREVGGALTTYFNAMANTSNETFSELFTRERAMIWPSKYGDEGDTQEPAQEETTKTVDYSDREGQIGVDNKTGNRFVIRNGIPVKIGGDDG